MSAIIHIGIAMSAAVNRSCNAKVSAMVGPKLHPTDIGSQNTNPLVNRFADPDDLIDTVARDRKIRDLQLTYEFINSMYENDR